MSDIAAVPMEATRPQIAATLDAIHDDAQRGAIRPALDELSRTLTALRRNSGADAWKRIVATARMHPLRDFVHRDPFTFRCFAKPRGYPGDAPALDYVLRRRELTVRAADPVAEIHDYMTHGALARALIFRRDLAARVIEETAAGAREPVRVFAAGCGHLRECDRLRDATLEKIAKIVAFDMDAENLDAVRRDYPRHPIAAHLGSIRQIVEGRHLFGEMDLVRSGALLETLPQPDAAHLVRALFAMLKPRGTLLLTNLLESFPDAGYVETYMDWRITYRTRASLEALAAELPSDAVDSVTWVANPESTLGAVAIQRR